jgi:hypothetical protein
MRRLVREAADAARTRALACGALVLISDARAAREVAPGGGRIPTLSCSISRSPTSSVLCRAT